MQWPNFRMTPTIELDDDRRFVVQEFRLGSVALGIIALVFAGAVLIPIGTALAAAPADEPGFYVGLIIGLVLVSLVVGGPFLVILAVSKSRRLEIRDRNELICTLVYTIWSPRSVRVGWDEIDHVLCEKTGGFARAGLRLTLYLRDGTTRLLLSGPWPYAEEFTAALGRHLAEKFKLSTW